MSPQQIKEQAVWIKEFEQNYHCKLTISPQEEMVNIEGDHKNIAAACPICEQPIFEKEASVVGNFNGIKSLVHHKCLDS